MNTPTLHTRQKDEEKVAATLAIGQSISNICMRGTVFAR
jgi:hypothetical protein